MNRLIFLLISIFIGTSACQHQIIDDKDQLITYKITPQLDQNRLKVEMTLKGDDSTATLLSFQNYAWGEENLFNCLDSVSALNKGVKVEQFPDKDEIHVSNHRPKEELRLVYYIQKEPDYEFKGASSYRPEINSDYFHILGHSLLALPQRDTQELQMKIQWNCPSEEFYVHNSFGNEKEQILNIDLDAFYSSLFVGGDYRSYQFEIKGKPVYYTTRGKWKTIKDDEVVEMVKKTIETQRNFWNDHSDTLFTIFMTPTNEPWTETSKSFSLGGTAMHNSFGAFCSNNDGLQLYSDKGESESPSLVWLYNHELMHNWIGHTIKNKEEEQQYWFSEGFTEYYAHKNMLFNNFCDTGQFLSVVNSVLRKHQNSPVSTAPNDSINRANFWGTRTYQKLPYNRGFLYAFFLDGMLYKKGKKLNDLMHQFYEKSTNDQAFRLGDSTFIEGVSYYLDSKDVNNWHQKYILDGEYIDFTGFEGLGLDYQLSNKDSLYQFSTNDKKQLWVEMLK